MKIEYIINGNNLSCIKSKIPKEVASIKVKYKHQKISGNDNFLLTVSCEGSPVACAKVLSEMVEEITSELASRNVKNYLITDEASRTFFYRLYPLVCQFETKLRRLVYVALFDLDDEAKKLVVDKIKKSANDSLAKISDVPTKNFLEEMTMSHLFNFLFGNRDYIENAKNEIGRIYGDNKRTVTKKELIDKLSAIEEKTVWSELFSKSFYPLDLPSVFKEVFDYRNDTMHFHFMPYKRYKKAYSLLSKTNTALDLQIAKDIVLENTPSNVGVISNSTQFNLSAINSILKTIAAIPLQSILDSIEYNKIITQLNVLKTFTPNFDALSNIIQAAKLSNLISGNTLLNLSQEDEEGKIKSNDDSNNNKK